MKKITNSALWLLTFSLVAMFSCNDPSIIGSDLLSGDELDIEFTDTLTLRARTVLSDSVLIWDSSDNGVLYQNFSFGDMQDPIFGRSVTSIYAQVVTNTSAPDFGDNAVLDSVVLMLAYAPSLCYGKLDEQYTMEVYQLDEQLDKEKDYYTTDSFAVKQTPIGTLTFEPNITDSVTVVEPSGDSTIEKKLIPHLRVRLDDAFGNSIMQLDSAILADDSSFLESFKGIWLKPASQNAGMLNFAMRNTNTNLRFYYHNATDTTFYDFRIYASNPVTMHQRNYYAGSLVEQYISQQGQERNDSLLFLQGMKGLDIEFEIPFPEQLSGIIINKAELVLPIMSLPEDSDEFDPTSQMYANEVLSDTSLAEIDDIYLASLRYSISDFGNYFGGKVEDDDTYKLSLSAHLQQMIEGKVTKKIRISPYIRAERIARVVLGGPGHSVTPAKLKITYTRY